MWSPGWLYYLVLAGAEQVVDGSFKTGGELDSIECGHWDDDDRRQQHVDDPPQTHQRHRHLRLDVTHTSLAAAAGFITLIACGIPTGFNLRFSG